MRNLLCKGLSLLIMNTRERLGKTEATDSSVQRRFFTLFFPNRKITQMRESPVEIWRRGLGKYLKSELINQGSSPNDTNTDFNLQQLDQ